MATPATPVFGIGQMIAGKYSLDRHLGDGGYGTVWAATNVVADQAIRQCALKLIQIDPADLDSQLAELRQSLQFDHPNIVKCYDCGEFSIGTIRYLYLSMELADTERDGGPSLLHRLGTSALSEAEALALARDLAEGLAYLHGRPRACVHRDLKPGNILRIGGRWKIADFGLAREMRVSGAREKSCPFAGTPDYAPPEVYESVPYTTAWDMWSLGVLLVEARTGRRPFRGGNQHQIMNAVLGSAPDLYSLSGRLREIAERCLVRPPNQRLTSQQVIATLTGRRPTRVPRVLLVAILLVALVVAGPLIYRTVIGKGQTTEPPRVAETKKQEAPPGNSIGTPGQTPEPPVPAPGGGAGSAAPGERAPGYNRDPGAVAPTAPAPAPAMNPPPIEIPSRSRGGISLAPPSQVEPGPVLRAPDFAFTLRAYKDDISANTPPFEAADARLTAMSATVRAFGAIPADTTATIRWLRRDSTSPTAREQEVGSISRSGAAIAGEHECPNKAILPGKYRVELLINGVPQPKPIEFSVKNF
jgi:hypothetical protein